VLAKPLASRTARLVAALLDTFLAFIPIVGGFLITPANDDPRATTIRLGTWIVGSLVIVITQLTLLSVRGQSLGKIVTGVRIVDFFDESNPGFARTVWMRMWLPALIGIIPILGQLFILVDWLSIFGESRRCIHDAMARTKVVEA